VPSLIAAARGTATAYATGSRAFKKVDLVRVDNSLSLIAANLEVVGD